MDVFGIGIESSCDETSVAVVKNGREILINPIFSQTEIHQPFGGVIPEKASRAHLEKLPHLLLETLPSLKNLKMHYIAVTVKPGLVGSLLVGYNTALCLSWLLQAKFIGVHHLEAHLYAPQLTGHEMNHPFLGLLLSGGNSAIYLVQGIGKMDVLCDTVDDACGEALDKAANLMGLPYPGGPYIEKEANLFMEKEKIMVGFEEKFSKQNPLPTIQAAKEDKPVFSFSGIKTALLYFLQKNPHYPREKLCYFFLQRLTEHILHNLRYYLQKYPVKNLVFSGGVAANQYMRKHIENLATEFGVSFISPPPSLCTDNGAMVAAVGYWYYVNHKEFYVKKVESDNSFSFK